MDELPGEHLPNLSKLTGRDVRRVADGHGTSGGAGVIFLEQKYANLLEPMRYRYLKKQKQAKAIYLFLHEYYHTTQDGIPYKFPKSENDANKYAASNFRWFCRRKLNFSVKQTMALWNSLPDFWQKPSHVG